MESIIELLKAYKINNTDLIFNKLIEKTKFLAFKHLIKVHEFYREDLYQELLYGLFQVVREFKLNNQKNELDNQRMFLAFLDKKFTYICKDFLRKTYKNHCINIDGLYENRILNEYEVKNLLQEYISDINDLMFLESFIEGNELLSEREVGKKLKISQQAVNKRKKQLHLKYMKQFIKK